MKKLVRGVELVAGGMLIALSVLIFTQVLLRNTLGWGFVWAEEMARYLLLTLVLLMAPVIFFRDEHVRLNIIRGYMSAGLQRILDLILLLLCTGFFGFYIRSHIQLVSKMGDVRTPSLNMPNSLFFLGGLIGAVLGLCFGIVKIVNFFYRESQAMSGLTIILLFLFFTLIGLPISFGMGISAIVYFLSMGHLPISILAHRLPNALNSFPLVAVPVFIFAGNLMNTSGITERLFRFARMLVGHRKGGLAHVNILASLIFSGISGAALADIGGLGNIEIKAMTDQGYDPGEAAAITASSATIGPIFPPSIPLIIFASVAEISGVKLLLAGIVPALLITALLIIVVTIIAHKRDYPRDTATYTKRQVFKYSLSAFPALLTPVLLVGGLLSGWFSPTEVAAVTVAYSIFLGTVVYRELSFKQIGAMALETIRSSAIILFVVGCASVFAWALTVEQVPAQMAALLTGISQNPVVLLLMVNVLLLLVGMIMDTIAAILVMTPIIYPGLMMAGVDPIHLGIVVVLNLMIGLLTPPVGMSLYMVSTVSGVSCEKIIRKIVPFFIPLIISLLIVSLVPSLSTFLPNLIFK